MINEEISAAHEAFAARDVREFNALQMARMQKRMEFRKIMICSLVATIISGTAGIVAAYCGMGLWALILYNMMNGVIVCFTAALAEKWLPKFEFSLHRA